MRLSRRWVVLALAISLTALAADPPPAASPGGGPDRLVKLAKLWATVRYRHPYLLTRRVDWDAALLAAIPKVESAASPAEYSAAVSGMLAALGDPLTRVIPAEDPKTPAERPATRPHWSFEGDILIHDRRAALMDATWKDPTEELEKARAVVIDSRGRGFEDLPTWRLPPPDFLLVNMLSSELKVPGSVQVEHDGYRGASGASHYLTYLAQAAPSLLVPTTRPRRKPAHVVFLIDDRTPITATMLAMRSSGAASLVSIGPLSDESVVEVTMMDLGEGLRARVRLDELIVPVVEDRRLAPGKGDPLKVALELARRPPKRRASTRTTTALDPLWRPDPAYENTPYPDRPHRVLAAIRLWSVIKFFYPYQDLLDRTWDDVLPEAIDQIARAGDAREYGLALARVASAVQDSHTLFRNNGALDALVGEAGPFLAIQDVEGRPTITRVAGAAAEAGLDPGDVVLQVDGTPIEARIAALAPYATASTPAHLRYRLLGMALRGKEGSTATLEVEGANGRRRTVKVTRQKPAPFPPVTPSYRLLAHGVGFVDLTTLTTAEVPLAMEKLRSASAIIFDLRGYPNGTAWSLAPYLNVRGATQWARFGRMQVSGYAGATRREFIQEIPEGDVPRYQGKVIVLIDERAISQSEHTGLMLEVTSGATFVGSPTAGANGDVTWMVLPGDIRLMFSGHDVRHADGRQLQRMGLQPHVPVRPTIAGLRAGRDEVLERALDLLARTATE